MKCFLVSPFGLDAASMPAGTRFVVRDVKFSPLEAAHKIGVIDHLDGVGLEGLSKRLRQKPCFLIPATELGNPRDLLNEKGANQALQLTRFSLEIFTNTPTPMAAFAVDDNKIVGHAFDKVEILEDAAELLVTEDSWENHFANLSFLLENIGKAPAASLAIERICRAHRYGAITDGVIDLAISLECLVQAQTEVKFQFALNHSLVNVSETERRLQFFTLLQSLYDVRSKLVHGGEFGKSEAAKLRSVQENWDALLTLCRENIIYYILYCSKHGEKSWAEHLRGLALGAPREIVGGQDAEV